MNILSFLYDFGYKIGYSSGLWLVKYIIGPILEFLVNRYLSVMK